MSFSLSDRSKCFTLHTVAYLFIPTQILLLREAFSHVAITVRTLCRLYSVGALLHNYMTTVIICFNLQYAICRGPLEQQFIRYLTSNVFGSGCIGTDSSAWILFCQNNVSRRKARIMVVGEPRRQLDDVSYLYVFEGLHKSIVSVEDVDAL